MTRITKDVAVWIGVRSLNFHQRIGRTDQSKHYRKKNFLWLNIECLKNHGNFVIKRVNKLLTCLCDFAMAVHVRDASSARVVTKNFAMLNAAPLLVPQIYRNLSGFFGLARRHKTITLRHSRQRGRLPYYISIHYLPGYNLSILFPHVHEFLSNFAPISALC